VSSAAVEVFTAKSTSDRSNATRIPIIESNIPSSSL
jgi:hypothetical protein